MLGDSVLVRDTKNRSGGMLSFTIAEWEAFVTGVSRGEFSPARLGMGS